MDTDDEFDPFSFFRESPDSESKAVSSEEENKLSQYTFQGDWEEVEKLYEEKAGFHTSVITSSKDTALHMAISDDREQIVEKLVQSIVDKSNKKALEMKNSRGETPLHRAATRKSVRMCVCIVEAGQRMSLDLLSINNKWGETPIFTAALYNRKPAFIFLHNAAKDKTYQLLRKADLSGDTALHSVIRREHFVMAFLIIKLCPELMGSANVRGITPLHVLASKPSAFRSGLSLSWWKQIIYYCVRVDPLKYDPVCTPTSKAPDNAGEDKRPAPANYQTCYQFLGGCYSVLGKIKDRMMRRPAKSSGSQGGKKQEVDPEVPNDSDINKNIPQGEKKEVDPEVPNNSYINTNIPQNYTTCIELLVAVLLTLLRFSGLEKIVNKIREEKEKHKWSAQILKELMTRHNTAYISEGTDPGIKKPLDPRLLKSQTKDQDQKGKDGDKENKSDKKEEEPPETYTPLLAAAQKGAIEVVNEILSQSPVTIYETTSKDRNILQVAVENRQPRVIKAVQKQVHKELKLNLWADLIESVDTEENTILHLGAKYDQKSMFHPWKIHGTAMQMQWEIKWYEYVKSLLTHHHYLSLTNKNEETPEQIFTKDHEDLVKASGEWLKDTSESCSVVAALVAGVSFATSSQVPGGTNGDTGKPTLEGQPAFELFAITALIGLCFSVTALIMFLSILTSRKQPRDFKKNLPLKILLGLSSLFVSIASMLVSFCAAHFFVLEERFKTAVLPLYAATCLPVSFYAIVQFPLYMDLLQSIVTKAPQALPSGHV